MATKKKKKENSGAIFLLIGFGILASTGLFKKPPGGSGSGSGSGATNHQVTEEELNNIFDKLTSLYGNDFAREIEQLYRKETAHFKSGQFLKTYSPGMEIATGKTIFPYGWGSLQTYSDQFNPDLKNETYLVPMKENNTDKIKSYIGFPTLEDAVLFVAYTLKKRVHPGYWRSTQKDIADKYRASYKTITPKFT